MIPSKGQKVVWVTEQGQLKDVVVEKVLDVGAGLVEINGKTLRYVNPAGNTKHEINSWHFATDDTSNIKVSAPEKVKE
jgi:hypothetical protein